MFRAQDQPNLTFATRRVYSSRSFILPVVFLTIFYNIPKFFELYVKEEMIRICRNGTDVYNVTVNVATLASSPSTSCENGTYFMVSYIWNDSLAGLNLLITISTLGVIKLFTFPPCLLTTWRSLTQSPFEDRSKEKLGQTSAWMENPLGTRGAA